MAQIHGRRLLPTTIDQIARDSPNRAWASMQLKDSSDFEDISIYIFANAINRITHWIVDKVGAASLQDGEKPVLAYVGPSDLRYYVLFMAIVKAGYVPLFISHVNSESANSSLFSAAHCKSLLCGFETIDRVAIASDDVDVFYIPTLEAVWDPEPVPAFPFAKGFNDAFRDPLLILHTSGSTGVPKLITYTHGSFAAFDERQDIPDFDGHESEPRRRAHVSRHFIGLPPFHAGGIASGLHDSIFLGTTIVFPRADRPLNAQSVIDIIDNGRVQGGSLLPHVLEDLARTPEAIQKLKKVQYIIWVGGPISQHAGDILSAQTTLLNAYASTEMGPSNTLIKKDRTLWQYHYFHPHANGFEFRPVTGQSNLYELFVIKNSALSQPVFRLFPNLEEWPMKDLFTPHPSLPHYWRLEGRSDDLLVLQNGNKVNPLPIEAQIKMSPDVNEVLMFGAGRARPGILIEPLDPSFAASDGAAAATEFLDGVFPFVEISNRTASRSSIIVRELLILTKPSKPFPRTGKGTLRRPLALELYQEEIDATYRVLPNHLQKPEDFRIVSDRV